MKTFLPHLLLALLLTTIIPVSDISLDETQIRLEVGDMQQLTVNIIPPDATSPTLLWTSSKENVATVDAEGLVEAQNPGFAIITVSVEDTDLSASCLVRVSASVSSTPLSLNYTFLTMRVGNTQTLYATQNGTNGSKQNISWTSTSPSVVQVDGSGNLYAISPGTANIAATTEDGRYTAFCTVIVTE